MEDRYLYKAKRIDNGEWVQGYLYGIWEKRYILWGMTNDVPDMIEVDPSTICQCTGLKDEINRCKWKAVVEFGNPTGEYNWGWQLVQVTECEANKDILLWIETEMSYMNAKIIGNTIDNLELVESEE